MYQCKRDKYHVWVEEEKGCLKRSKDATVNRESKYFRNSYLHTRWSTYGRISVVCFLNLSSFEVVDTSLLKNVSSSIFGLHTLVKRFTKNKRLLHVLGNDVFIRSRTRPFSYSHLQRIRKIRKLMLDVNNLICN